MPACGPSSTCIAPQQLLERLTLVPMVVDALRGVLEVHLHNLMSVLGVLAHDYRPLLLGGGLAAGGHGSHKEVLAPLPLYPVVGEASVYLVALLSPLGALGHDHQRAAIV